MTGMWSDAAHSAFGQQHADDVFGRVVAKELTFVLFMEGDAVLLHQIDEVLWRVARQGRAAKVRVFAQEVALRSARVEIAIREIAATATGNAHLLGHLGGMVDDQNLQS